MPPAPPRRRRNPPKANIAFEKAGALVVPAGHIALVDNSKPVAASDSGAHDVKPAEIANRWISKRTRTIQTAPGMLTITITDASVAEQPKTVKTDWRHMFDRQAEKNLVAAINWRMDYQGPSLNWTSNGSASSTHSVLEESSLNEADQDYADMIESLAAAFDMRAQQQVADLNAALAKTGAPMSHQ